MPASADTPTIRPSPAIVFASASSSSASSSVRPTRSSWNLVFRREARSSEPVSAWATISVV
jgi:hypothetical protein